MGSNRGAVDRRACARAVPADGKLLLRRGLLVGRGVRRVHHRAPRAARGPRRCRNCSARVRAPSRDRRNCQRRAESTWRRQVRSVVAGHPAGGRWRQPPVMGRFLLRPHCHARVRLLGARRGPQSGRGLRRPARDRLGVAADDRRLRGERAGRRAGDAGNPGIRRPGDRRPVRRRLRPHRRSSGPAPAHLLLRHDDAGTFDHRHADRARLEIGDRRRRRHSRAVDAGAARFAMGLLLLLPRPRADLSRG